jgi:hypothetical protein
MDREGSEFYFAYINSSNDPEGASYPEMTVRSHFLYIEVSIQSILFAM